MSNKENLSDHPLKTRGAGFGVTTVHETNPNDLPQDGETSKEFVERKIQHLDEIIVRVGFGSK